jgi:2,3-bisphosphoglycerate-independent phosphoglycerate mutase
MTSYGTQIKTQAAYPPFTPTNTLGDVLARHGLSQLRLAETEKYAHVTFFFNGGSEAVFPNEQRILIPSPQVATYDLKPVMSAEALTQIIVEAIHKKTYDVIICNYANADMVGHTGNFDAAVEAIEALDQAFYEFGIALEEAGGQLLITADHGNAECMFDESTQQPHTAHTNEPVPLLYVSKQSHWHFKNTHGSLIDIAPTILSLLGITPPPEMTGKNLLIQDATTHD